ncbi:MAG: YfcE family phosphodiesterase [Clostridia bacterium]|nr:YfcE family phosphodiesterase [Clostridia bacterium]
MKLLVVSDSHGKVERLRRAVELNKDADAIIHLGDGYNDLRYVALPDIPVYKVRGNGEDWLKMSGNDVPRDLLLEFDGIKILMMHGHTHSVKSGFDRAIRYALDKGADLLLFGHTHGAIERYIPKGSEVGFGEAERDIYIFNPGSIGEPRFGEPKFGLVTIREGKLLLSHGEIDL